MKDVNEEAIIERGKELSGVKYKGASSVVLDPPQIYDISKSNTCISSRFKFQTS